jgi:hypothetical protein
MMMLASLLIYGTSIALSFSHLWDPHVGPALPILCKWLMRVATANMWEEFMLFLVKTHGSTWHSNLDSFKLHVAQRCSRHSTGKHTRGEREDREEEADSSPHEELHQDVTAGIDSI